MGTPTMHRAKTAQPRVRMEGWRQRRPGSNGRNPQKGKEKKEKTHLTHTGLLMEGTIPYNLPHELCDKLTFMIPRYITSRMSTPKSL